MPTRIQIQETTNKNVKANMSKDLGQNMSKDLGQKAKKRVGGSTTSEKAEVKCQKHLDEPTSNK